MVSRTRSTDEGAASGGEATPTVTGPTVDDAQPGEFPIDVIEWQYPLLRTQSRLLTYGFLHLVRQRGEMTTKKLRATWQAEFDAWCVQPAAA